MSDNDKQDPCIPRSIGESSDEPIGRSSRGPVGGPLGGPTDEGEDQLEPEKSYLLQYLLKTATDPNAWELLATIAVGKEDENEVWRINRLAVSNFGNVQKLKLSEVVKGTIAGPSSLTATVLPTVPNALQLTTATKVAWALVTSASYTGHTFAGTYGSGTLAISFRTALVTPGKVADGELIEETDWFNPKSTFISLGGGSVTLTRTETTAKYASGYKATAAMTRI